MRPAMTLELVPMQICPGCGEYGHQADHCPKHPRVPRVIAQVACDDCGVMPGREHEVGCVHFEGCAECGALPGDPHDAVCDALMAADQKLVE